MSLKEGKGTETFANGDIYVGDFSNDLFNGLLIESMVIMEI